MSNGLRSCLCIAAIVMASSCSTEPSTPTTIDAVGGEEIFNLRALGGRAGCVTCHSLSPDHVIVGPSLAGIGDRAGTRIDSMDAEAYIRNSILAPDEYVVDGFEAGKMPAGLGEVLSTEQVDAVVEFLLEVTE